MSGDRDDQQIGVTEIMDYEHRTAFGSLAIGKGQERQQHLP